MDRDGMTEDVITLVTSFLESPHDIFEDQEPMYDLFLDCLFSKFRFLVIGHRASESH